MAIDQIPYRDTEEHVDFKTRRFWPASIPISHWQLRHFVSNPEPHRIYYAAGPEVFCLDTQAKQHKLIATLPFNARCTASGFGWVGVGGEKEGHYFAAIKLDGSGPRSLDVDSALPLEPWRGARRSPSVRVEKIGEEIVNSISIHRLRDEEAHLDDVVAVLTNNDRTVRVFSLPQNSEAYTLELPHPVNHATISPDGKSLIVVGDFAQAFIYSRRLKRLPPQIPKPHNRLTSADVAWDMIGEYDLYLSSKHAPQGYFTTAWSPDNKYVAVGSEDGHITVFDATVITKPNASLKEAVFAIIPSSRSTHPNPYPGAVRTMIFSPAPWDLLIWAEDQGRVCVSDLRTGLRSKQILSLDPKDTDMTRMTDIDTVREGAGVPDSFDRIFSETQRDIAHMEAEFMRRHQEHGVESTYGYAPNYVEARRVERQRRLRSNYTDDPEGLTAREQYILDTLRESRQRQEANLAAGRQTINYTNPEVLAPYSMRARMLSNENAEHPAAAALPPIRPPGGTDYQYVPGDSQWPPPPPMPTRGASDWLSRDLLPPEPPRPDPADSQLAMGDDNVVVYDLPRARAVFENGRARAPRSRDGTTLSQTWRSGAQAHRSGRNRGEWPSIFLPTPPRSQPATSSPDPEPVSDPAQEAENENSYDEGDDTEDDEAEGDEDIWRGLDDAMLNTRGPLFEYAARAQAPPPPPMMIGGPSPLNPYPPPMFSVGGLDNAYPPPPAMSGGPSRDNPYPPAPPRSGGPSMENPYPPEPQRSGRPSMENLYPPEPQRSGGPSMDNPYPPEPSRSGGPSMENPYPPPPPALGSQGPSMLNPYPPGAMVPAPSGGPSPENPYPPRRTTEPRARAMTIQEQRERIRNFREELNAATRADHAAMPALSRTRAAADGFDYEGLLRRRVPHYGQEIGVRTAGLAMSEDGSTLWAACEEGIFEFSVNRKARMFWPAVEPR